MISHAAKRKCARLSRLPNKAVGATINGRQLGVSFRRQVPLGNFIVDFLAPAERLIVEVRGGYHSRRRAADGRCDRKLARCGYRILHLDAKLVDRNLGAALALIRAALS